MKNLNELSSDIYGTLFLASMGGKGDELAQVVREAGVKEEHLDLILKSAEKIIEERDKHQTELTNILTREELSEDESEKRAIDYLKSHRVNEQLIDHVLTYNTFVLVKAGTEELIAVGREEGYSERDIKRVMRKEMKLDKEMVDSMYEAATLSFAEATKEPFANTVQKPVIEQQKPARLILLSGIACMIVAYLNYQMEWAGEFIGYTAFILGVILLRTGIKRAMN